MTTPYQLSIYDQMRSNRWRTLYFFLIFPLIIVGLIYLAILIAIITSNENLELDVANEAAYTLGFWILLGVIIWSLISYFLGARLIMAFAGAKAIKKSDNPELYRVVENVSIAAGLPKTPEIYVINDASLNAFATGTSPQNAKVAISSGLLEKLSKAELEAVMGHEIGHVLNRDIRVMLLAITLVGAIEMVGEVLIRTRYHGGGSNRKGAGGILILAGVLFLTIGVIFGTLARLAISREREYLADSTSAHLTSNPLALAGALEKIAADARLETLDQKASLSSLCIADPTAEGHQHHRKALKSTTRLSHAAKLHGENKVNFWQRIWSTHPPIMERIQRLRGW